MINQASPDRASCTHQLPTIFQRYGRLLLGAIVLLGLMYLGRNYLGELHRIRDARPAAIMAIVCVYLLSLWLQGLTVKWGLDSFGRGINSRESFGLFVISSYANLLLPRSGMGATALYLKRTGKSSLIHYSSVVLMGSVLFVFACSSVACLVVGIDWFQQQSLPPVWLLIGLPMLCLGSGLALALPWTLLTRYRGPGSSLLDQLVRSRDQMSASAGLWQMGLGHLALVFMRALRLYFAFWALQIEVSFHAVLLTSLLGDLAFIVAITPGALGFREAAIGIAAYRLGIPVSAAISAALLDRLVYSLAVVVAANGLMAWGWKKLPRASAVSPHGEQPGTTP